MDTNEVRNKIREQFNKIPIHLFVDVACEHLRSRENELSINAWEDLRDFCERSLTRRLRTVAKGE